VKLWDASSTPGIDFAEYLRSRWVRLVGSEMLCEPTDSLFRDRPFVVVNLPETPLLGIEHSGRVGSQKLPKELSFLLRAGNLVEAIALWKATPARVADLPTLRLLLAALSVSAADDLLSKTWWRGLWLTEQTQSMITSEAMVDPAVSLGMLRLATQLTLAGSDDGKVVSVHNSFNARIAGMVPRSWFVALGSNLSAVATEAGATRKERQVAVEQLRSLTKQLPDSAELRRMLADALSNMDSR
jgi:hypothetical protein